MSTKSKKHYPAYIIAYLIFGVLFAWGTIGLNDLNFDKMVFNPTNKFAFTMACYGMFPRVCIQLFGYTMLMVAYRPIDKAFDVAESLFPIFKFLRKNKFTSFILNILYRVMFLAFIYGSYQGSNEMWNFVLGNAFGCNLQDILINAGAPSAVAIILWTILRVATMVGVYFLLKAFSKKHMKVLELMAVVGLSMYYSENIINILKEHFHRIRFREMVAYSNGFIGEDGAVHGLHDVQFTRDMIDKTDFHWFTNWYRIGQDDGVVWHDPRSFPSGHTSAASFAMLIIPLFSKIKELQKLFAPACIVGFGYTMAMGLSRMMRGAHYMTDVTGAAIIMLTIMLFFTILYTHLQNVSDKKLMNN